jgi:hypothetical protein
LSPKGEFISVDYGNHAKMALSLEKNGLVKPFFDNESGNVVHGERLLELSGYIKFVCRFAYDNVIESHVFFPQQFGCRKGITNSQKKWLKVNFERMTEVQESDIVQYLY